MDRAQSLLQSLTKEARIIEIGPSFNPLAPKRDGWNTFVIDHASRDELIKKYHDQTIDRIEDVDFVWSGGSLADAVPSDQHGSFDAFIASHVIEHTTDIVTFLRAAETLLRPDGVVILAVPDKRKCFDFFRYPSATADAIAAFLERRDRHTVRTHIDYALNMALKSNTHGAWAGDDVRPVEPVCSLADEPNWRAVAQLPHYTDAHAWVFVPASFRLMILELSLLGYLDLRVEDTLERHETEFFVWLRKGAPRLALDEARRERVALMHHVIVELAEQSRHLPDDPLGPSASARALRDQLQEARIRTAMLRTVLAAVRESTSRLGLDRRKFRRLIALASQTIPATASAAIQHRILLAEATKVLDRQRHSATLADDDETTLTATDSAVLVGLVSAARLGDPSLASELEQERQRSRAVRIVLNAVLASLRFRSLDRKRFKSIVAKAAQATPNEGPEAARHAVLLEESRKVLGVPPGGPS
ncbi:methyltransferase domain-containing protein [Methylobacterium sp. NEAU K]|uniref:methyltransferase domain-containing protein n=1 Tax=Methylobacterium sp. NEAU K TaxID=3064946 RepID=UPI002737600F|nr:methyltransferase domain-containing protein [Methylobacterium sp. NEAU K]MDP4003069.1 methyltransferase domain-containing protein [Methylobacterium sp. NEAU K]